MESETVTSKSESPQIDYYKRKKVNFEKKNFQSYDIIIMLQADKGNAIIVMDKLEYSEKLVSLQRDGSYCKVKKRPNPQNGEKTIADSKEEQRPLHIEGISTVNLTANHCVCIYIYIYI